VQIGSCESGKKNFEFLEGGGDLQVKRLSPFQDIYYYCTEIFLLYLKTLKCLAEITGADKNNSFCPIFPWSITPSSYSIRDMSLDRKWYVTSQKRLSVYAVVSFFVCCCD